MFGAKKNPQISQEWVQQALVEIDKLDPDKRHHEDSDVRYSLSVDDLSDWENSISPNETLTFQQLLMKYVRQKYTSNREFYKAALMDRKLFSAINNDVNYHPRKETAVACCFALILDYSEAEELLKKAGYTLSLSIQWDRIVYYCLKNGIYDIDSVNALLYERGEKCIRA